MKKSSMKYLVDVGMGLSFLVCFITGLMKWPNKAIGRIIPTHEMTLIHDYSGLIIGLFVMIHLILNWKWIVAMTKKMI